MSFKFSLKTSEVSLLYTVHVYLFQKLREIEGKSSPKDEEKFKTKTKKNYRRKKTRHEIR